VPIFPSTVFVFDSFSQFDPLHTHELPGFTYSRTGNPGFALVEEAVASLENASEAIAYSSGMAAVMLTLLPLVHVGDHIVCANVVYGATSHLIKTDLSLRGVGSTFVDIRDLDAVKRAVQPNTKALLCETISNPLMEVADLSALADIAHAGGVTLIVDNSFASPCLCRPLEHGADIVVESATKYLNGHNDVTMGIAAYPKDPVGPPDMALTNRVFNKNYGACPSPFDCWLLLRGIRTLSLRVERHCENAMKLAAFLLSHPKVTAVNYPGLTSSPYHDSARKYLDGGFGGMLSFETTGEFAGAEQFATSLKLAQIAPTLGGPATTITHPGKTSHVDVPIEDRMKYGVGEGLIRVSAGLEYYEDIERDFAQALERVRG